MDQNFKDIIEKDNIRAGYLDLAKKFDMGVQSSTYYGLDAATFNDYNYSSEHLFDEVIQEMLDFKPISPATCVEIPKKRGGIRRIYIYTVRDRVKAEAAYRILEPIFDAHVSPFVYSYRSSHPAYYAARSAVRRYQRHFGENFVFTADLSDYTDSMDQDLIMEKVRTMKLGDKTEKLIELFVKGQVIEKGEIISPKKGLMTGTPLSGLLSNLYMNEFDSWAGKYVALYRRIGDDMIAFDKDLNKIELVNKKLREAIDSNKIKLNEKKVHLGKDTLPFMFLGYRFKDGKVGIDPKSINNIFHRWQVDLYRYPGNNRSRKINHLKYLAITRQNTLVKEFDQIIKQKMLVDDQQQVKQYSEKFFHMMTKYVFGRNKPEYRRQLKEIGEDIFFDSLYNHYNNIHFPDSYAK